MTLTDKNSAPRQPHPSNVHPPSTSRMERRGVPGFHPSRFAFLRSGGALAATALAAGLAVGTPGAAVADGSTRASSVSGSQSTTVSLRHSSAQQRLVGVRQDLMRAVHAGDVTQEQADRFLAKLSRHVV